MVRPLRRLAIAAVTLGAALATSHCQQDAAAPSAAANDCCEIAPNAALLPGMGNIVVKYPADGGAKSTRFEVYAAGDTSKAIDGDYGDAGIELAPGTYDVTVGGRRVAGVGVQAGHDTRIRAGVLHVRASEGTRIELIEPGGGARFVSGYGDTQYGLPVGSVAIEVFGQQDTALIEDGKVTDFGNLGRVVVAYPEEVAARIEVFRAGETKALAAGYGNEGFDLFPGTYDVSISGKRVAGLTVRSGEDTHVEVGMLRVNSSEGTRVELVDLASQKHFASGYGTQVFGLPVGEVGVQIAGQTENVVIEAGQITDF
jgi:lipoate-protein ligase A